jgi:tRNA-modifying protein YgfZ
MEPNYLTDRAILRLSGTDINSFLQGITTNDVNKLELGTWMYNTLLTPQGKLIAEFFMQRIENTIWLDAPAPLSAALLKRLQLYKLRADVIIESMPNCSIEVYLGTHEPAGEGWASDPRLPEMGYRRVLCREESNTGANDAAYLHKRIELGIPEYQDWIEDRSFPMEMGIRYLKGISYTKGCYVGQEVVARSTNRGTLRKAIHKVEANEALPAPGEPILQDGKQVGTLRSTAGNKGLAILSFEAVEGSAPLMAGSVTLKAQLPHWFPQPEAAAANT